MGVYRAARAHYYIALLQLPRTGTAGYGVPAFPAQAIMTHEHLTYRDAGVDIDAGNALVERIKPLVARTARAEVMSGLGGFGGLFALEPGRYREPVLVSGTDGVGTKLKLAIDAGVHDTIGVDLVAMCVNDVLVQGAEPLFFLDYFACGRLDVEVAATVVGGIARGCEDAGAALIGGETAEMPDMYRDGEYDLAGFCVGAVEKSQLIDGHSITAGDAIIGLAASGPHSNGYSLIRKVLAIAASHDIDGTDAQSLLLRPTTIYVRPVFALLAEVPVRGLAHITGGGITENLPRVLPAGLAADVEVNSWQQGAVFDWLAATGHIAGDEMRRTFNCGIGMTAIVASADADRALARLSDSGQQAWRIGTVVRGTHGVRYI